MRLLVVLLCLLLSAPALPAEEVELEGTPAEGPGWFWRDDRLLAARNELGIGLWDLNQGRLVFQAEVRGAAMTRFGL